MLGIAAILLLAVAILIWVRVRQRRERDAQLAPLRAAAQAPRGARADGAPGLADDPLPPGVRRAPFDDPAFVPPSFQEQAFGASPLGGQGLSSQGLGGPVLRNPVFGDPGENGSAYSRPAPGRPPLEDPAFGTVAADSPSLGAAGPSDTAAAEAAFLRGVVPVPFGNAAADAPAAAEAAPPGSPFGRPAAGDAPAPSLRTLGSAHRLNSVRAPKTTGHPPWGPAEKPEGELPWVDAPARPPAGRMVPPRRSFPPGSDAGAGAPPPGDAGGPGRPADADRGQFPDPELPFAGAGGPPGNLFGPGAEPEPAQRRVHAWNPADSTEALPRIRTDDQQN